MKHLLIIGARGWGREIFNMLPDCFGYQTEFDVKGFLDDNVEVLEGKKGYPPIIGNVEDYTIEADDIFVCALGDISGKKKYSNIILDKGGTFCNIIHKSSNIERNSTIGRGCILCKNVEISCDAQVGDFVTFQAYSSIGHDSKVGNFCHLGVRAFMGGYSLVGSETTLQTCSIVLPHIKVGNNSIVGAGAVVIKKVKDGTTVYGNPAKELKY